MATVAAAASVILVAPATAAPDGTTSISGVANWAEECGGQTSDWTLVLDGDLTGCLYTTIETAEELPGGVYVESGTEVIVGCLNVNGDRACGSFTTTYTFYGEFADTGQQVFGKCHHPIVAGSGSGALAGITGRLGFSDNVDTGEAVYTGFVNLP